MFMKSYFNKKNLHWFNFIFTDYGLAIWTLWIQGSIHVKGTTDLDGKEQLVSYMFMQVRPLKFQKCLFFYGKGDILNTQT